MRAITLERLTIHKLIHEGEKEALDFWKSKSKMDRNNSNTVIKDLIKIVKDKGLSVNYSVKPLLSDTNSIYDSKQSQFISRNNLEYSSPMKIVKSAESNSCGWNGIWTKEHEESIGKTLSLTDADKSKGLELANNLKFPYWVLEKQE